MINSAAEEEPVMFSHPNTVSPLNLLFFLLFLTTNPTKHTVPCLPAVKHNWIAGKDKHEEMFADKITSKNNSASQWDNGVSRLRVCVHRFTVDLFCVCTAPACAHINALAAVCHLSALGRSVSELDSEQWFYRHLPIRGSKSWHVPGFEATLLATT